MLFFQLNANTGEDVVRPPQRQLCQLDAFQYGWRRQMQTWRGIRLMLTLHCTHPAI